MCLQALILPPFQPSPTACCATPKSKNRIWGKVTFNHCFSSAIFGFLKMGEVQEVVKKGIDRHTLMELRQIKKAGQAYSLR